MTECPGCGRRVPDDTLFCPSCRYLLRPIAPKERPEGGAGARPEEPRAATRAGSSRAASVDVGSVIGAGVALWRAARGPLMWLTFYGLFASLPAMILSYATGFDFTSPATFTPMATLGMALALLLGLPFAIGSTAGSFIVLAEISGGGLRSSPLSAFVRGALLFKRILGAWFAMLAVGLAVAAPVAVAWFTIDETAPLKGPIIAALGAFSLFAGVFLWTRWAPATAVLVIEGRGPIAALSRASALTRGRFFRVLGVLAAMAFVSLSAQIVAGVFGGDTPLAQIVAMALEVVLVGPLSAAVAFSLYTALASRGRG